ncbi:tripartite motif-containing protein 3-like [Ostrea edulis]|uniref:tripartite motif-containing protein 3-like n=1 Tax=Ostrea edulis TaxID=37623 RepID=UPI0024AED15F|nr:tripartite motif-containing protein 3-like [Ostrea edulis]XP_056015504.1 tripartite motif-containing protein 3-like [Ostrea edulis]XP_056015505.1 tripartite motif-containing protein 3-like [Ostrea edulis]
MDPRYSAQDVLRCDLCDTPVPPMYCDLCEVKLCKACVGEHLSDLSNEHKVVPFIKRGSTVRHPKCSKHADNQCELYCQECDTSVCAICISSNSHKGHTFLTALEILNFKRKAIEKDFKELQTLLHPKYEQLASEIKREKSGLETHYSKLTTTATQLGEVWHRQVDVIVNRRKSNIDEMKSKHLDVLTKQEDDITHIISELKQTIRDLRRILDSNDVSLASSYKSRNSEFRALPSTVKVTLPSFSPHENDTERLDELFGSLSALSITTEEHGYTLRTPECDSSHPVKALLDEPQLITTIETGYNGLRSVTCLNDEEIWTRGESKFMKLYDIRGKLLKSSKSKSGNSPEDIDVTSDGELVYTDREARTVNIVKNKQMKEVIRLQEWKPNSICSTSSGDLLVTMVSDDIEQSKVVRYSGFKETQVIQFDDQGRPLYSSDHLKYISENRNLDICVADNMAKEVVVVNQAGQLRYKYTGHISKSKGPFCPYGITTDSQSQILTADYYNDCIHILDQDGQFLRYIDNCGLHGPWGLCVDERDNLFVAEFNSGKVKKIRYL